MSKKTIGFNIWDDYYDDDSVPKGEIQETYAYVEEEGLTKVQEAAILDLVYKHIQTLDMKGVKVIKHNDIDFKNLTHERREKLVEELSQSGLTYEGVPIDFYSES